MKKNLVQLCVLTALTLISTSRPAFGGTFVWNGVGGVNLFWENAGNWTPSGPPGTSDFAVFFDPGATNAFGSSNIDNEVTGNMTVQYLWLSQTNNYHNMQIDAGVTLTIKGTNDNGFGPLGVNPSLTNPTNAYSALYVGTRAPVSSTEIVSNSISGPGTLFLNNTNNELNVRQCFSSSGAHQAVLDMSGLNTFVANLGRIRVGDGELGTFIRAQGQLRLAATNTITLNGTNSANDVNLVVGNNSQNNNGNGSISYLFLGQTNRLNLNRLLVGAQKQQGQILFNPLFASPSLVMRASDGVSRVSLIRIGDESDAGATGNGTTGTLNLLPGTADILADAVIVGKSQNGNNSSAATGNFSVGTGTVNINTLTLAAQATASFIGTVTGTATFSNTIVNVNSLLQMGASAGANYPMVANLYIDGGSMTVNGTYQNQGTVTINVTNATLMLPAGAAIAAKNISLDGGILANAATIKATNTLTIADNGSIVGAPILDLGNDPSPAAWDVQGIAGGSLIVSNTLQGAGTIAGNVILDSSGAISPGGPNSVGTLSISPNSGNLTLNNGSTLDLDLSASGSGVNDQISASGTVTVNGTVNVYLKSLAGALDTTTPYTLITASTLNAAPSQFQVVGPLTTGRYTFTFDTTTVPNTVRLIVGGTGPANQTWVGDAVANLWNAQGAFNWNNGTASSQFFNLDNVSFTDTGSAAPPVSMVGALVCGSMTLSNNAENYTIGGSGSLTAAGPFNKAGTGSLTINNQNANILSSLTTISNGPVTFANNGLNTFAGGILLGGGSLTLSGNSTNMVVNTTPGTTVITIGTATTMTVANSNPNTFNGSQIQLDGTLAFNQPVNAIVDSVLIDAGNLIQSGASTLTLAANNSGFSGPVLINGGTIAAGSTAYALGLGPVTVTNTGALDVNGNNVANSIVTVSGSGPTGAGALVSSGPPQNGSLVATTTALQNVIMAGNTTFGGSGSWNTDPIRNNSYFAIANNLGTGGNSYNLTKTGPNQVSLINAAVDPALGNINVQQGMLNFQGSTTSMGNPAANITVSAGATLSFYDTGVLWTKNFILFGDGVTPTIFNYDGTHVIDGPVTLNGNCIIAGAPAGRGVAATITMLGPITGSGSLNKSAADNQGSIILAGTNTYAGTTTVAGGGVYVDGINGTNTVTVSSGATLGGTGVILGAVSITASGILSPGDLNTTMATLVISNSLSIAGTCAMDLSKAGTIYQSDLVTNITTLNLNGCTLQLNPTGDPLAPGDSFQLFSFNSANGTIAAISPETPGVGLTWDTTHLTKDGTLRVVGVNPNPTNIVAIVSGGQLHLSWPADHTGWRLQVQTNALNTGLSTNWTDVPGSTVVNSMSFPIDPTSPAIFYQMTYP